MFLLLALVWALRLTGSPLDGQSEAGQPAVTQETINKLLAVIAAHEARIRGVGEKAE
jgi:hypothetical protein